ncbi:unnamed protein product [Rhizophagus irregularis]|nr:unnamed protein product [Rhizophagus irregularis]
MYRKKFSTYTTKQTVPSLCAATVKPVVSERTFSISPQSSTSSIVGRMRQSISEEFTNPNNQSVEAYSKSQRKGLGCHCPRTCGNDHTMTRHTSLPMNHI